MHYSHRIRASFGRQLTRGQSLLSRVIGEGLDSALRWGGVWEPGLWPANVIVRAGDWLMVSLRRTEEPAAPAPIGSPEWVSDALGGIQFTSHSLSAASLFSGSLYRFTTPRIVRNIRFQVPASMAGNGVSIMLIRDPLTDPHVEILFPEIIVSDQVDQWIAIPQGMQIIRPGSEAAVVIAASSQTGESGFSHEWDYKRKNGTPSAGEVWHQSGGNQNDIRFHQEDDGGVDRSSDLDNIDAGSSITMLANGMQWEVLAATKIGPVYYFTVNPAERVGEDKSFFSFTYYAQIPIGYVRDDSFYSGFASVSGVFGTSLNGLTEDDHGYGIDIETQEIGLPDDWDIMALS